MARASTPTRGAEGEAVAARTYIVANLGQFSDNGYDVFATRRSQVHKGQGTEHPLSSQAVDQTRGQVLTFEGRPINACTLRRAAATRRRQPDLPGGEGRLPKGCRATGAEAESRTITGHGWVEPGSSRTARAPTRRCSSSG